MDLFVTLNALPNFMKLSFIGIIFCSIFFAFWNLTKRLFSVLLDAGEDKYGSNNNIKISKNSIITSHAIKKAVLDVISAEANKEDYEIYKQNLLKLADEKSKEITDAALEQVRKESTVDSMITNALEETIERKLSHALFLNDTYRVFEEKVANKSHLIGITSFLEHLQKEYNSARSTKKVMSNVFIVVNLIYFAGLFIYLQSSTIKVPREIFLAISFSYIGLGAFVVYMIKFCNVRTLTLLSLREDFLKREHYDRLANKIIDAGANEHSVALYKMIASGVSAKEQGVNHPYEMLLYGIKDSNIMFKGGKFEIKKEVNPKDGK